MSYSKTFSSASTRDVGWTWTQNQYHAVRYHLEHPFVCFRFPCRETHHVRIVCMNMCITTAAIKPSAKLGPQRGKFPAHWSTMTIASSATPGLLTAAYGRTTAPLRCGCVRACVCARGGTIKSLEHATFLYESKRNGCIGSNGHNFGS